MPDRPSLTCSSCGWTHLVRGELCDYCGATMPTVPAPDPRPDLMLL